MHASTSSVFPPYFIVPRYPDIAVQETDIGQWHKNIVFHDIVKVPPQPEHPAGLLPHLAFSAVALIGSAYLEQWPLVKTIVLFVASFIIGFASVVVVYRAMTYSSNRRTYDAKVAEKQALVTSCESEKGVSNVFLSLLLRRRLKKGPVSDCLQNLYDKLSVKQVLAALDIAEKTILPSMFGMSQVERRTHILRENHRYFSASVNKLFQFVLDFIDEGKINGSGCKGTQVMNLLHSNSDRLQIPHFAEACIEHFKAEIVPVDLAVFRRDQKEVVEGFLESYQREFVSITFADGVTKDVSVRELSSTEEFRRMMETNDFSRLKDVKFSDFDRLLTHFSEPPEFPSVSLLNLAHTIGYREVLEQYITWALQNLEYAQDLNEGIFKQFEADSAQIAQELASKDYGNILVWNDLQRRLELLDKVCIHVGLPKIPKLIALSLYDARRTCSTKLRRSYFHYVYHFLKATGENELAQICYSESFKLPAGRGLDSSLHAEWDRLTCQAKKHGVACAPEAYDFLDYLKTPEGKSMLEQEYQTKYPGGLERALIDHGNFLFGDSGVT